ncbi:MAG: carboxymuconolactone decarboxylase family protein [Desulfurivibrionaceae bacterium]
MSKQDVPRHYESLKSRFPSLIRASEELGEKARDSGPLDDRTAHLIQLAAAAAIRSEGSVHSHARRALQAGASKEEVYQAVLLLVSTVGFPTTAAAVSWIDDLDR